MPLNSSIRVLPLFCLTFELGVAVLGPTSLRRVTPPSPGYGKAERGVGGGEDQQWRLVVQDALDPVLDEATRVASL